MGDDPIGQDPLGRPKRSDSTSAQIAQLRLRRTLLLERLASVKGLAVEREQRLAYLLFHCGLKPREIVRLRPQEFHNVQDIYRLRCNITEQLLRNVDRLRWQLRAFPKII